MTSPVTPIQSPRDSPTKSSNLGVSPDRAKSWMRPDESASVPKATLPWSRRSMSRPATDAVSPVSMPGASSSHRWWRSAAVSVRSNRYGTSTAEPVTSGGAGAPFSVTGSSLPANR